MSHEFILQWPPADDGSCRYAERGIDGAITSQGRAGPAELAERVAGQRCRILVPGEEVLVARIGLPTRNRSRIRQALPFALEEQLADDIETLHFAIGRVERDGTVQAAAVADATVSGWLEALAGGGIEPRQLVPENGVFPPDEAQWRIVADEQRALLVEARGAYILETALLADALDGALASGDSPPARIDIAAPEGQRAALQAVLVTRPEIEAVETAAPDELFTALVEALPVAPLDLRQGPHARREQWGWLWRPLRPAAALLAVALVLETGMVWLDTHRLAAERDELRAGIEQVYRDAFPDSRVVNPRVQMERRLAAARGEERDGGGPLAELLAGAAPALDDDAIYLRSLRLRDGVLEVDLDAVDIEAIDDLRGAIESDSNLSVEVRSASARGDRADGRLSIRRGDG